jgi:hypothetical protein
VRTPRYLIYPRSESVLPDITPKWANGITLGDPRIDLIAND